MQRGIPMQAIDGMDLKRYIPVLAREVAQADAHRRRKSHDAPTSDGAVELRRGTTDVLW